MTYIAAENLALTYPLFTRGSNISQVPALQDVSFELQQGDRLGLVGANGAGKSTLLQVLAGIIQPDSGRVCREGKVQSLMAMGLGVNSNATGRENIRMRLLAEGMTWAEVEKASTPIEDYCELEDYLDLPVETYSSGMQLRLNFSIITSLNAEILIMDEWIGAGDEVFKKKATQRMSELVDQAGIVILASHQNELLKRVCNKGLWLEKGRLRGFGEINTVISDYLDSQKTKLNTI